MAGIFFYLYLFVDVWSRKVVAYDVHEVECNELASAMLEQAMAREGLTDVDLVLHSDNGSCTRLRREAATARTARRVPQFQPFPIRLAGRSGTRIPGTQSRR